MIKVLDVPQSFDRFFENLNGPMLDRRVVALDLRPSWLGVEVVARGRRVPVEADTVRLDLGRTWLHDMSTKEHLRDCLSAPDQRENLERLMRALIDAYNYYDNVLVVGHTAVAVKDAQRDLRAGMSRAAAKRKADYAERQKEYRRRAYGS